MRTRLAPTSRIQILLISSFLVQGFLLALGHHQQPLILIHLTLAFVLGPGPTLKHQTNTHQIRHHQVVVTVWCPIPFAPTRENLSLLRPNHQTSSSMQCVMHDLSVSCKNFFLLGHLQSLAQKMMVWRILHKSHHSSNCQAYLFQTLKTLGITT